MDNYYLNIALPILLPLFISIFILKFVQVRIESFIKFPEGPQKVHKGNVSRLGGLSIFITVGFIALLKGHYEDYLFLKFFIISIPAFTFGFLEDITQSINPKSRLLASLLSAILFIYIFGFTIKTLGFFYIDLVLNYEIIAIFFTVLSIVYMIQAFNIIDGLNGLSIITAMICFSSIACIANQIGDLHTRNFSFYFLLIFFGVLILNFPFGKIFIGDGGAYCLGLFLGCSALIFYSKNTDISPFLILQILIYPSYELIRSFVRRFLHCKGVFRPDNEHLHSLLYRYNLAKFSLVGWKANSFTSMQIIFLQILNFILLINFFDNVYVIINCIIMFIFIYEFIYHLLGKNIKPHLEKPS